MYTNKKNYQLSVILPTYNEAGNIVPLIDEIHRRLKKISHEIIIIDDDSPDKTGKLVQKKCSHRKYINVIIRKKDKGLARSIKTGIDKATGITVAVMDTDFNHHPKDLVKMIEMINGCDIVVGSRYVAGGGMENKWRFYFSLIYNRVIRLILQLPTYDSLSGFFIIKFNKLKKLPLDQIFYGYGDYFIRFLFYSGKIDFKIKELPVYYKNRMTGKSKSKLMTMLFDYSKTVIELLGSK